MLRAMFFTPHINITSEIGVMLCVCFFTYGLYQHLCCDVLAVLGLVSKDWNTCRDLCSNSNVRMRVTANAYVISKMAHAPTSLLFCLVGHFLSL